MRIVYLNKVKLDASIPAVNFSLGNVVGLAESGAQTFFLAQAESRTFDSERLFSQFHVDRALPLTIRVFPSKRILGIRTNQWFYLDACRAIREMHRSDAIDAVISRDPGALPYLVRLKRRLGIQVYYQPHNFYVDLALRDDVNPKNAKKYHVLEKRWIPKLDGLFCLQEPQAQLFRTQFPGLRVIAAKPGLLSIQENRKRPPEQWLGYVGSLQFKKGIHTLLEAFLYLQDPKLKLVLVGGRNEREMAPVREWIAQHHLNERIVITGWLSFDQVLEWLDQIFIGLLPLEDTFYNRYLTAPNKFFDYLSRGIPMVASDLPAIRDFDSNGSACLYFKAGDADQLAEQIRTLLNQPKRYAQLSENALSLAHQYPWRRCGDVMTNAIRQQLSN